MASPSKRSQHEDHCQGLAESSPVQPNCAEESNSNEEAAVEDGTLSQDRDLLNRLEADRGEISHSSPPMGSQDELNAKVFNDPVHGQIVLPSILVKIIDTPQFQRLRYIKQLGGTYFVYPGATHTRFEHSLGVGYLAGLLITSLQQRQPELDITKRDVLCIQIAGLCHDLGHGPFSHLFDNIFIPSVRKDDTKKHEDTSRRMFDHLIESNELKAHLEDAGLVLAVDLTFIKDLIVGKEIPQKGTGLAKAKDFLYEIVANKCSGIDVDKWDYLASASGTSWRHCTLALDPTQFVLDLAPIVLGRAQFVLAGDPSSRDSHYLGFKNNFDFNRFLQFVRVCDTDSGKHIIIRDKEAANIYDMFYVRYSLQRRAYQHKVVKAIEFMINDALVKADKYIKIPGKYKEETISSAIDDMEAYTKLTDHIYEQILHSSEKVLQPARDILNRIVKRRIYRYIGEENLRTQTLENEGQELKKELTSYLCERPMSNNSKEAKYTEEDLIVYVVSFDYGMRENDPVKNIQFYSKHDVNKPFSIKKDKVSLLLPETFEQKVVRVYCKLEDDDIQKTITERSPRRISLAEKRK